MTAMPTQSLLLLFAVLVSGCASRQFSIEVENNTGFRVQDPGGVAHDGRLIAGTDGISDPGYSRSRGDAPNYTDGTFTVSWSEKGGHSYAVDVPVAEVMGGGLVHTLTFDLQPGGMVVVTAYRSFDEWADRDRKPKVGKRYSGASTQPASRPSG